MDEKDLFNSEFEKDMGKENISDEDGTSRLFDELKTAKKAKVSLTLDTEVLDSLMKYKKQEGLKELSPMINIIIRDFLKKNSKVTKSVRKTNGKKKGKK